MEFIIEKMIYGGEGLARLPADEKGRGKAVFLPFVLEGERVEATVREQKPGFVRARLARLLAPSPMRVAPSCPYFFRCGGCHYQHADYPHQLEIKATILRESLWRTAKLELGTEICIHPSPPWSYRNRTRVKLRPRPFALGYHKLGSHQLLPVEQCPISSPLINQAISAVWELGRAGRACPDVLEIEIFADGEDRQLLVELSRQARADRGTKELADFARALRERLPEVAGVAAFRQTPEGPLVREDVPEDLKEVFGADHLVYRTRSANYVVSAGSFFQTNRFLTDELAEVVTGQRSGAYALDLYAGTGLFALLLSQNFREVAAVESAPFSFHDLRQNCPSNVTCYRSGTEHFLESVPVEADFDLVVVDPPRAGLGEKVARRLGALRAPRITYVSCDPATFSRDLKALAEAGFRVEQVHLLDLFPQTFHIESVFQLVR